MTVSFPSFQFSSAPPMPSPAYRLIAVIGAGAAGLVAARELRHEGHKVVVFERGDRVGGTWVYDPKTESDPVGVDPDRSVVHSSLYASLRTNLPREVMGFRDYPFVASNKPGRDDRRFPGHGEVLAYLKDFTDEFRLCELVRFGVEVRHVQQVDDGKWKVRSRKSVGGHESDELYDAVVICSGHYTEPRVAEIPGINSWPGKQIHSHNYRVPEPFQDKIVVLIGYSASAVDISRDIAGVAKEVHIATRSETFQKLAGYDNIWIHSLIENTSEDGTIAFHDENSVCADIILHCTGYKYHFPFLETNGIVTVDDSRVGPLYKHIFPPVLAPSLSFVGLPWKVIPFHLFDFQSKWVAGVLSGRISLPSPQQMMADVETFYSSLESLGIPKRYTHNMSDCQFDYNDWLASECRCPPSENWRRQMFAVTGKNRMYRPESYRDEWDDDNLITQAHQDFKEVQLL